MKLSLTFIFLSFTYVSLFSQGFVVDSFIAHITINKNGETQINEKIYTEFSERKRGIYRNIPYKFKTNGNTYTTDISHLRCNNNEYKVSSKNGNKVLRIGNANRYVTGKQVYDISYTVDGPFISSPDFQEFYWNITGNDWKADINKAKFYISLPDSTPIRYSDQKIFTGSHGSSDKDATIKQVGNIIYGETIDKLSQGEGLTVAIKLPKDYIYGKTMKQKQEFKRPKSFPKSQWPLGWIPFGVIAALLAFWNRIKNLNHTDKADTDEISYYPPLELNSAEVGAFTDGIVHDRDVMSLLPLWANQGFLKVEKTIDDMKFSKIKNLGEGRPAYEYTLFNALFKNRDSVTLEEIKYNFSSTISKVKSEISNEIIELKLYDDQYRYWFRSWRWWILIVVFIPIIIISFALEYWMAGIGFILCILAVIVIGSLNQKKSQLGLNVKRKINAFYNFMKLKDDKKFSEAANNDERYFENVYPYAVALNLDKNFTQRMKPYRSSYPYWYIPYGTSNTDNGFEQFSIDYSPKEISSAFTSVKSSSGSSDSGGFSGGGFGGGGGGSW